MFRLIRTPLYLFIRWTWRTSEPVEPDNKPFYCFVCQLLRCFRIGQRSRLPDSLLDIPVSSKEQVWTSIQFPLSVRFTALYGIYPAWTLSPLATFGYSDYGTAVCNRVQLKPKK